MGEYATRKSDDASIKIGTCEDMYYLRADQILQVNPEPNSLDPYKERHALRFRFPFPDEDDILPGDYDQSSRAFSLYGVEIPEGVQHYDKQFRAEPGYLVMLPCPESEKGKAYGFARNGFPGPVGIVQQRFWEGRLVTVCQCNGCGGKYRLETLADAEPILLVLRATAARLRLQDDQYRATMHDKMADRIECGYAYEEVNAHNQELAHA